MSKATPAPPPHLLTVAEAADHLDTTTSNLYELAAKRTIPSVRIGRAIRIPQEGLDRLAADVCHDPTAHQADQRTSHQRSDPSAQLDQTQHAPHQLSSSPTLQRPASDPDPMPERQHSEHQPSEPPHPNSCEATNPATDLHPRATRPRVDAASPREALS